MPVSEVLISNNPNDDFVILSNNRAKNEAHIRTLKKVYEEKGYLTEVDPIIVNEHMQVIDGQHRLAASQELGIPVYYRKIPGLTIDDARKMNINRKNWNNMDYAVSYANGGYRSYQAYLRLREDYPFNHTIMLHYIDGNLNNGKHAAFRNGDLVLNERGIKTVHERFDKLHEIANLVGPVAYETSFASAFLRCLISPNYDHERMVKKMSKQGVEVRSVRNIVDAQRQLEDIYNHGSFDANRVRLF